MCRVSDDGPTSEDATRTGAVVRKPPGNEPAVGVRVRCRGQGIQRSGLAKLHGPVRSRATTTTFRHRFCERKALNAQRGLAPFELERLRDQ